MHVTSESLVKPFDLIYETIQTDSFGGVNLARPCLGFLVFHVFNPRLFTIYIM